MIVSNKLDDAQKVDLVVVRNLDYALEKIKKKARAGTGFEVQISHARSLDSKSVAKWLSEVRELYRACKLVGCQLVVSSGATSPWEMVSGKSLDALLEEFDIHPVNYWTELESWVESRLERRVTI